MTQIYNTKKVAEIVGIHPNTVRLYEGWGYTSTVPRLANGYRQFSPLHVWQLQVANQIMHWPYPGGKQQAIEIIQTIVKGEYQTALSKTEVYLKVICSNIEHTKEAQQILEKWAQTAEKAKVVQQFSIKECANLLQISKDKLRNWERNGLIKTPRQPNTGYRFYTDLELDRLRIIKMLLQAGYSLMAILRMLNHFDKGQKKDLALHLDTIDEAEDVVTAADQWLKTLLKLESRIMKAIDLLKMIPQKV